MLTVGSLFAGIGGFDLGFERAGMRTLWQVEQNEFCRRVLAQHFPNSARFNDVREVTGCPRRWEQQGGTLLEYVDVLCGGFPCQDLSYAGKGAGLEGERSGLWSEYARLIRELRPRYVVVENVSALLARGLGRVLGDLAESGYDAEWDCIPASAVGAPHQRDRLWLVAYPASGGGTNQPLVPDGETLLGSITGPGGRDQHGHPAEGVRKPRRAAAGFTGDVADSNGGRCSKRRERNGGAVEPEQQAPLRDNVGGRGTSLADADSLRRERARGTRRGRPGLANGGGWPAEPPVGRVVDGFPGRVDRLRALGNSLVPEVAYRIGRRIIEAEGGVAA